LYPSEENESNVKEYKEIFKKVKELLKKKNLPSLIILNIFSAILKFPMRSTSGPLGLA